MKKLLAAVLSVFMILALSGCGSDGGGDSRIYVSKAITSVHEFDGDIEYNPSTGSLIPSAPFPQSILTGIDPLFKEYRSFLAFDLVGPGGEPIVPKNAIIYSADLDIYINSVTTQFPSTSVPLRIDLVFFDPPKLVETDFDRPALGDISMVFPIYTTDAGNIKPVTVDVTSLMEEARYRGLDYFQVRIMRDGNGFISPGLVEIDDFASPPQLRVTYY